VTVLVMRMPLAVFKLSRMRTPRSLDASLKHENIS
jgi:hypothetical protein